MEAELKALFRPADDGSGPTTLDFHLREVKTARVSSPYDDELWAFGERPAYQAGRQVGYQSVAVRIEGVLPFVYAEALDWSADTVAHLVDTLNRTSKRHPKNPNPIVRWERVNRQRLIGFDYARRDQGFQRPYVRLWLRNPSVKAALEKATAAPIPDQLNVPRQVNILWAHWGKPYFSDLWAQQFLHTFTLRHQTWIRLPGARLVPHDSQWTTCQREYVWVGGRDPTPVTLPHDHHPMLCATLRLMVQSHLPGKAGRPEEPKDQIVALGSEIYWSGHDSAVVRLALAVDPHSPASLRWDAATTTLTGRDPRPGPLLHLWHSLLRLWDLDVLITLHDFANDNAHMQFRVPEQNLSKFRKWTGRIQAGPRGSYFGSHPGRSALDLRAALTKMQLKPMLASFTLAAASEHNKLYQHPQRAEHTAALTRFHPNQVDRWTVDERLRYCALEASVLRGVERTPNVLLDALALSTVCNMPLTMVLSHGQQVRCLSRLMDDCHQRDFVDNPAQLRALRWVGSAREHNSYPDPPSLPNVVPRQRDVTFHRQDATARAHVIALGYDRGCGIHAPPQPPSAAPPPLPPPLTTTSGRNVFGRPVEAVGKKRVKEPRPTKYPGGLVHDPHPGFYAQPDEMIATLDFGSLYPSIFQSEWFCYSNLVFRGDEAVLSDPRATVHYVPITDQYCVAFVVAYDGVPTTTIMPNTERALVAERDRVKRLKDQAEQAGDAAAVANFDKQQLGCKLVQNALYGFTGVRRHGFRSLPELMASITAVGRWQNRTIAFYALYHYRGTIMMGDTDSIMVLLPPQPELQGVNDPALVRSHLWSVFTRMAHEMTALFRPPNKLNFEALNWPMLLFAEKKNYVSWIREKPDEDGKLKVSGLGFKKRDRCRWVRFVGDEASKMLMKQQYAELRAFLVAQLQRLEQQLIRVEDLAVTCALKDLSEYKCQKGDQQQQNLVQLKVARKIERRTGLRPSVGSRISFVQLQGRGEANDLADALEYVLETRPLVDWSHYLRQLSLCLTQLFTHHAVEVPWTRMMTECQQHMLRNRSPLTAFFSAPRAAAPVVLVPDVEVEDDDDHGAISSDWDAESDEE